MRQRSTLIAVILLVVLALPVATYASVPQWSAGISLTESVDQSGIFSRIDVQRSGQVVGSWFSTSGILPVVFRGLEVAVYGDFPGISRIKKVFLSPDQGKTRWPATLIPSKGYQVMLPDLEPGSYGLEWGVESKDKHNRLTLIIIPINWSSKRNSAAANHFMVQQAPEKWENLVDQQVFAFLRGFVPAWATPDPAYMAQMGMMQQQPVQVNQPVSQPAVQPDPPVQVTPEQQRVPIEERVTLILRDGKTSQKVVAGLDRSMLKMGAFIRFRRHGRLVLEARVSSVSNSRIEAVVTRPGSLRDGDEIFVSQGGVR